MSELEEMKAAEREAQALRRALEANDRAVRQFLSSAAQVHSAYTYALGQVRKELNALERSFQGAAASVMGAFAGMLNGIRPALSKTASLITKLLGVTYWKSNSKDMDAAAASLGRVARSTRSVAEAQKDLYSFDKITRVSAPDASAASSGGGGHGSGSGGSSPGGEWVHIPGLLDELAQKAKTVLSQLWKPFQDAWKKQGEQTVQSALDALSSVGQAASAVGESWMKAWTGGAGERAVTTVLLIIQRLNESVKAIADNFRAAWQEAGLGDKIMSGILSIVQSVLDGFLSMASATAIWAEQLDFHGLVEGFSNLITAIQPLVELIMNGLSWCYTNVLLPLAGWVIQSAGPAMLNALSGAIQLLTTVLNALKPIAEFVWNYLLKPMGQWSGGLLVNGLNSAAGGFRTLSSALNGLPSSWDTLKQRAGSIWNQIKTSMVGSANASKNGVTSAFRSMFNGSVQVSTQLSKKLGAMFNVIANNAKKRFSSIGSSITTPFRKGFNGVINLANMLIQKMNSAMRLSWSSARVSGKKVLSAGSMVLARMSTITHLAEGGVTTGPTFSLIGEAGREAVLPLERNTSWMDTLAERIGARKGSGDTVIEVHIGGERIARQVVREVNNMTRQTGHCPIYL